MEVASSVGVLETDHGYVVYVATDQENAMALLIFTSPDAAVSCGNRLSAFLANEADDPESIFQVEFLAPGSLT